MEKPVVAWDTIDEIKAISYLASDEQRGPGKKSPSLAQRRFKLKTWLITADQRAWPSWIDVFQCRAHAMKLKSELG